MHWLLFASLFTLASSQVVIFLPGPSPPPPPLSDAKADWLMLYCFLGLLVLWLLVMAGVLCFSYGATSSGEKLPLNGSHAPKVEASARPRSWMSSNQPPQSLHTIDREIKKGFVRKVYSILATQLLITAGIAVGMIYASFYHGDPNVWHPHPLPPPYSTPLQGPIFTSAPPR